MDIRNYTAQILADSINTESGRLITILVRMPRFLLPEIERHRYFSFSIESSRARNIQSVIDDVRTNTYVPIWTLDQKGMSGNQLTNEFTIQELNLAHFNSLDRAIEKVMYYKSKGVHKQNALRSLEEFMFTDVIVTATEKTWNGMFDQRLSTKGKLSNTISIEDSIDFTFGAQPEIQLVAATCYQAISKSKPKLLQEGEWHCPYQNDAADLHDSQSLISYSAGRCATISFGNHNLHKGSEYFIKLCHKLSKDKHWSPLEHQAQAVTKKEIPLSNISSGGWHQHRKCIETNI